jgi:hypothetical protein
LNSRSFYLSLPSAVFTGMPPQQKNFESSRLLNRHPALICSSTKNQSNQSITAFCKNRTSQESETWNSSLVRETKYPGICHPDSTARVRGAVPFFVGVRVNRRNPAHAISAHAGNPSYWKVL